MPDLLHVNPARFVAGRTLGAIAAVLIAALLGWAPVAPAAAHGELVSSDPSDGGLVEALPSRAVLTFSDAVSTIREISVSGPDGSVVNGDPTSTGAEVRQNLWAGPDGAYTMEYYVVSADGHDVRGEVHFEVGSVPAVVDNGTTSGSETPATAEAGWWDRGRDAVLPTLLVLLAAAAALVLMRRQRSGRMP